MIYGALCFWSLMDCDSGQKYCRQICHWLNIYLVNEPTLIMQLFRMCWFPHMYEECVEYNWAWNGKMEWPLRCVWLSMVETCVCVCVCLWKWACVYVCLWLRYMYMYVCGSVCEGVFVRVSVCVWCVPVSTCVVCLWSYLYFSIRCTWVTVYYSFNEKAASYKNWNAATSCMYIVTRPIILSTLPREWLDDSGSGETGVSVLLGGGHLLDPCLHHFWSLRAAVLPQVQRNS